MIANRPGLGVLKRSYSERTGDCYVHGLMDGEGLGTWKEAATTSFERSKAQLYASPRDIELWRTIEEDVAEGQTVIRIMKMPEFIVWLYYKVKANLTDFQKDG